jgi:hypothetical protein
MIINALKDVHLDDPKLNIMSDIQKLTNNNINTKAFKISPKKENFEDSLQPLKSPSTGFFNILPFQDPIKPNINKTSTLASTSDNTDNDYKKKLKEIEDLTIVSKDLINELETLQDEINDKNKIIDLKSNKIDELMHENNRLLNEIKIERENNENDFNSWLDLKTNLEVQVHNLKNLIDKSNFQSKTQNNIDEINDQYNNIQLYQNEINKLKKKVTVLLKENELEVQSKKLIMDELEIMRERYLEIDEKHELLKLDYDDLIKEFLILKNHNQNQIFYDNDNYFDNCYSRGDDDIDTDLLTHDEEDVITPTLENSIVMQKTNSNINPDNNNNNNNNNNNSNSILRIKKRRRNSRNSSGSNSRIASLRNNSLNRAIREVELSSQKQKYKQELLKYEFEIKSLKLHYEKLLSYVGYSTQLKNSELKQLSEKISNPNFMVPQSLYSSNKTNNKNNDDDIRISSNDSNFSNKTATFDTIEYSDAYNIKTAKMKLKTVMKSASAMHMRPNNDFNNNSNSNSNSNSKSNIFNSQLPITVKKIHKHYDNKIIDDDINSINDLTSNSMDCSTDYNQGEVECLDFGNSDSFEEFGDDELDEDDDNLIIPSLSLSSNEISEEKYNDELKLENGKSLYNNKNLFASNCSLNVSYKMNIITPQKREGKLFNHEPKTQLKKITPSILNLNKSNNDFQSKIEIESEEDIDNNDLIDKLDIEDNIDYIEVNEEREDSYDEYDENDLKLINGIGKKYRNKNKIRDDGGNANNNYNNNNDNNKGYSMYQISEEGESEFNNDSFNFEFSSSEEEDDDDGDEDETFNISNQEIDMFKIDLLRFYCPKHSMFQCFCDKRELVNRDYYRIFSSPIYALRRRLRQLQRRKNRLGRNVKYLRYQKHYNNLNIGNEMDNTDRNHNNNNNKNHVTGATISSVAGNNNSKDINNKSELIWCD